MARRPSYRPGARLGVVLVAVVALYASMVGTGHTTPKLGLDLQGGTTVILTPKSGVKVSGGQLSTAVDIIRQRVNGLGVSEADVVRQGNHVVISVPGKGRNDVLDVVGQTAFLTFREIDQQAATGTPPGGTQTVQSTSPTPSPTVSGSASPTTGASGSVSPTPAPSASSSPTPSATAAPSASTTVSPGSYVHPSADPGIVRAAGIGAAVRTSRVAGAAAGAVDAASASPTPSASPSAKVSVESPAPSASATTPITSKTAEKDQTVPSAATTAAFAALNCAQNDGRPKNVDDDIHHFVIACDRTQNIKYLLKPAQIVGTDVSTAAGTLQTTSQGVTTGDWVVDLTFKNSAISKVESITARLFAANQAPLAITLDGVVQSAPSTNGTLGKNVEISGGTGNGFTEKESKNLANVLKYGSLPVPFTQSSVESISATLGTSSLHAGLLAGLIGLLLVLIYVFLYYRALGLVTVASLAVSAALVYASVTLLGQAISFTLTLSGIAGLIVSIGITADSFVVFFERLKDEIHEGRSPRQAVEYGWVRARRTILSADTVSFMAALILYEVSIGSVRGFAFTLGLSTLLDIAVVFLFTKPLMTIIIRYKLFSISKWSGLSTIREPQTEPVPKISPTRTREA